MFSLNKLPIYYQGEEAGALEMAHEGLYLRVVARCSVPADAPLLRLWAADGNGEHYLGIPAPDGDARTLSRRIPASEADPAGWTHGVLRAGMPEWRPFSGAVCGIAVAGGLRREQAGGAEIAIPFEPDKPFAFLPLLPQLRTGVIDGRQWMILRIPTDPVHETNQSCP